MEDPVGELRIIAAEQGHIEAKKAFRGGLLAGMWWQICRAIARGELDAGAWLAGLPEPRELTDPGALNHWQSKHPAGKFFDPIGDLTAQAWSNPVAGAGAQARAHERLRLLYTAALQLHVTRLAVELEKGGVAGNFTFATPLSVQHQACLAQLHQASQRLAQLYQDHGVPSPPRAWSEDALKFWLVRLLSKDTGVFAQRLNVLWVRPAPERSIACRVGCTSPRRAGRPLGGDVVSSPGHDLSR